MIVITNSKMHGKQKVVVKKDLAFNREALMNAVTKTEDFYKVNKVKHLVTRHTPNTVEQHYKVGEDTVVLTCYL